MGPIDRLSRHEPNFKRHVTTDRPAPRISDSSLGWKTFYEHKYNTINTIVFRRIELLITIFQKLNYSRGKIWFIYRIVPDAVTHCQ